MDDVVVVGDKIREISLASSGDPIIHMYYSWISGRPKPKGPGRQESVQP